MAAWLEARLRAEEDTGTRLTSDVYRVALRGVASRIEKGGQGWVRIDRLDGVPRFDASKPPGLAVERLLQADILESLPGYSDRIRFVFEIDYAKSSRSPRLLHRSLLVQAQRPGLRRMGQDRFDDSLDPRTWVTWWEAADSDELRMRLLGTMSPVPHIEIEQTLIRCLDNPLLRTSAASVLGHMRSYRAATPLRRLLDEKLTGWDAIEVVRSLGRLGDPAAVGVLDRVARDGLLSIVAVSLGAIGTEEAERVLVSFLDKGGDADWAVSGLFLHGSRSAVACIVAEVKRQEGRGPLWLAKRMKRAFSWWGWTVGRYYTHVDDGLLIEYLLEKEEDFNGKEKWDLIHAVEQIDSENVRRLLRLLASRYGTAEDAVVRENDGLRVSWLAYRELLYRGDSYAVEYFVNEAISLDERRSWVARDLGRLPIEEVACHLRLALPDTESDAARVAVIRVLGFFGSEEDANLLRPYLKSPDNRLADTACEALCRLTDPLLVPTDWSQL